METQTATSGHYPRLHVFVFSVAYLWTMLTLDAVYVVLLLHGFVANRLAERRERLAARSLILQPYAAGSRASTMREEFSSEMDSDMQQAA